MLSEPIKDGFAEARADSDAAASSNFTGTDIVS